MIGKTFCNGVAYVLAGKCIGKIVHENTVNDVIERYKCHDSILTFLSKGKQEEELHTLLQSFSQLPSLPVIWNLHPPARNFFTLLACTTV